VPDTGRIRNCSAAYSVSPIQRYHTWRRACGLLIRVLPLPWGSAGSSLGRAVPRLSYTRKSGTFMRRGRFGMGADHYLLLVSVSATAGTPPPAQYFRHSGVPCIPDSGRHRVWALGEFIVIPRFGLRGKNSFWLFAGLQHTAGGHSARDKFKRIILFFSEKNHCAGHWQDRPVSLLRGRSGSKDCGASKKKLSVRHMSWNSWRRFAVSFLCLYVSATTPTRQER